MPHAEVIVVGGGLSGLSAARRLSENGVEVLVLESNDRVGGRTFTRKNKNVKYVDVGGAYVCPGQDHILTLAKQLGVDTYQVFEDGNCICFTKGIRTLYKLGNPIRFWNILATLDLNHFSREFDRLSQLVPLYNPWSCPHAEDWDKITMKEYINKTCWTSTVKNLAHVFVTLNVTCESHEVSLLWFLWYIRQRGGVYRIFSSKNQGWKFIGGSQQISDKMKEELGEKVHLNKYVVSVDQSGEQVLLTTLDGVKYKAQHVILAIPPSMQGRIDFKPCLPPHRNQLIQRMPLGSVAKAILYYDTTFWRIKGYNGSIVTSDENHPCVYFLDDTKPDGTYPALIGFLAGDRLRRMTLLPESERKRIICESLEEILGTDEVHKVIHYEEQNWMTEPYCPGGYTSVFTPGGFTKYGWTLSEPMGRVFYAGTETAVIWSGYMDGAVQAGYRAAKQVLRKLKKCGDDIVEEEEDDAEPNPRTFLEKNLPSAKSLTVYTVAMISVSAFYLLPLPFSFIFENILMHP